jgi:hypothetical protein
MVVVVGVDIIVLVVVVVVLLVVNVVVVDDDGCCIIVFLPFFLYVHNGMGMGRQQRTQTKDCSLG